MKYLNEYRVLEKYPRIFVAQQKYLTFFQREKWANLGHTDMLDTPCFFEDKFSSVKDALKRIEQAKRDLEAWGVRRAFKPRVVA
jgi:hypothetical protein